MVIFPLRKGSHYLVAKCSKCKQQKQPLHKRGTVRLCQDCLHWQDQNSHAVRKRDIIIVNSVGTIADGNEKPAMNGLPWMPRL